MGVCSSSRVRLLLLPRPPHSISSPMSVLTYGASGSAVFTVVALYLILSGQSPSLCFADLVLGAASVIGTRAMSSVASHLSFSTLIPFHPPLAATGQGEGTSRYEDAVKG